MTGLIDIGGGMRDIYGAGVMDRFLDENLSFDLCIGVSAGSANVGSFLAKQRGRNYRFYTEYALRKEYMSVNNLLKSGSYLDLDYIYSTLTDSNGEYPINYDEWYSSSSQFLFVATDMETAKPCYFGKEELKKDDFWMFKASCAIPIVCRPYEYSGKSYCDGGVADPIPVEKAFSMGCDRVVVVIPRPCQEKRHEKYTVASKILKQYPEVMKAITKRQELYNRQLRLLREYEKDGKAIIIAPEDGHGITMLSKNTEKLKEYYKTGYDDAVRAIEFITEKNNGTKRI